MARREMMEASVVTIVRNEADRIGEYLRAIAAQDYSHFEVIIVDDGSTDGTVREIEKFSDPRITCLSAKTGQGVAALRNIGVQHAKGKYIFFTDGDCAPSRYWLSEGIRRFQTETCEGVEGRTFYHYQNTITISDYNTETLNPDHYMTCNMAYRKSALERVGFFDPNFDCGHEDRDLALRVKRIGRIIYAEDMLVCHQEKRLTPRAILGRAFRAKNMVYLFKKHQKEGQRGKLVLYPSHITIILFPFLLISHYTYRSLSDVQIGFVKYFALIIERLLIWYWAIKYRIFLL